MQSPEDKAVLLSQDPDAESCEAGQESLTAQLPCNVRAVGFWSRMAAHVRPEKIVLLVAAVVGIMVGTCVLAPAIVTRRHDSTDSNPSGVVSLATYASCGGKCKSGYECVMSTDYSQCVDCNPDGNYQWDCESYQNDFRIHAIVACGLPCDRNPPTLKDGTTFEGTELPSYLEPVCTMETMVPDYKHSRCEKLKDGSMRVSCEGPDAKHCGMRFSSSDSTGVGSYTVAMQGAPGPGVLTTFYLYTHGRNESRSDPWSSIAFKLLGQKCGEESSQIWTTFTSDGFDPAADVNGRQQWYPQYVKVPFNACENWHVYSINIRQTTIEWIIDDQVYRKEDISKFDHMMDTIAKEQFQSHLKVYGQDVPSGNWKDMGHLEDNTEVFPIYAWFANLRTPTPDPF